MRATRLFALTVLASATVATGAAQAGEALYLTPPLFREQARETQQVRTLSDLTTTPQPCLLYTSPSPRDGLLSRMPSSA